MPSLKPAFNLAACRSNQIATDLILLFWILAILDDDEQAEKDARRKDEQQRKKELLRKGSLPRPF